MVTLHNEAIILKCAKIRKSIAGKIVDKITKGN
uniref:Uncharacterized protein n=1 Tax=Arundo donax TaxID=35708 RepID=A0A0A9G594_ARUDO